MTWMIAASALLCAWFIIDSLLRIPLGKALLDVNVLRGTLGFRLFSHAAPGLWWLVTVYLHGWGFELYHSLEPHWSITTGYTRSAGVRLWRISLLVYLGKLGREVLVRDPSMKWYDVRI